MSSRNNRRKRKKAQKEKSKPRVDEDDDHIPSVRIILMKLSFYYYISSI